MCSVYAFLSWLVGFIFLYLGFSALFTKKVYDNETDGNFVYKDDDPTMYWMLISGYIFLGGLILWITGAFKF